MHLLHVRFNWMIPNLYSGNDWKSPFLSIENWLFRVPGMNFVFGWQKVWTIPSFFVPPRALKFAGAEKSR